MIRNSVEGGRVKVANVASETSIRRSGGQWRRVLVLWLALGTTGTNFAHAAIVGLEHIAFAVQPLMVAHAPGDENRIFIVTRPGVIRVYDLVADAIVSSPYVSIPEVDVTGEGGLLGMAFHPEFSQNGKFYVYVTVDNGGVMIDGVESPLSCELREYTADPASNVANSGYRTYLVQRPT